MSNIPFPGLRSFKESEKRLFFGRDQEIWQLKGRLRHNRLAILLSPPKMGKTSLLRCGLVPELKEKGFPGKAGSQWKVLTIQPDKDPIKTLAEALAQPGILNNQRLTPDFLEDVHKKLSANVNGLVDLYRSSEFVQFFNLLIIVDPFDSALSNPMANHFTSLLLRAAKNPQVAVYAVFSLSTTSLPQISHLPELVEALQQSSFHLHPLNQSELEIAIKNPLEQAGVKMEDALLKLLVEKLATEPDQLVKLQESLWKTWWEWKNEQGQEVIKKSHYLKAVGARGNIVAKARMAEEGDPDAETLSMEEEAPVARPEKKPSKVQSLLDNLAMEEDSPKMEEEEEAPPPSPPSLSPSQIADKVYVGLSSEHRPLCRRIFQALTLKIKDTPPETLRPRTLLELQDILEAEAASIRQVMQAFVQQGSAIFPAQIRDNEPIRLGEPAIMEDWQKLRDWMDEEQQNALVYTNIAKRAERYFLEDDQEALLKGQTLKETLDWKKANKFEQGWAEQYHKKFNLAMEFLNICQEMDGQAPPPPPPPAPTPEPEPEPEQEPEQEEYAPPPRFEAPPPREETPPPSPAPLERPKIVIKKKN